jgi:DNA polymerase
MKPENYKQVMKAKTYEQFEEPFWKGCSKCSLSDHKIPPILWRGNPEAKMMLIGEAPGKVEQEEHMPFVGPAGLLLDKIMSAIGLDTEQDMLITNVVYCRPTAPANSGKQNYTPKAEQITRCWPFTEKAIEALDPSVIIACGRTALCALMEDNTMKIGQWEGKWLTHKTGRKVFAITHPAAVLHKAPWPQEQRKMKEKIWGYMQHFRDTWKSKLR